MRSTLINAKPKLASRNLGPNPKEGKFKLPFHPLLAGKFEAMDGGVRVKYCSFSYPFPAFSPITVCPPKEWKKKGREQGKRAGKEGKGEGTIKNMSIWASLPPFRKHVERAQRT